MLTELGILEGADENIYPEIGSHFPSNRIGPPWHVLAVLACGILAH